MSYARADDDGGEAGVEEVVQRAENELVEEHGLLCHEKVCDLLSCTRTRLNTPASAHKHTRTYARAHTHTHTHMSKCLLIHTHACVQQCVCIRTVVSKLVSIDTNHCSTSFWTHGREKGLYARRYTYIRTRIYIHTYIITHPPSQWRSQ